MPRSSAVDRGVNPLLRNATNIRNMLANTKLFPLALSILLAGYLIVASVQANDIAEIPEFMGDWSGEWTNPKGGYYRSSFKLMARVIGKGDDVYEVQFIEEFDKRVRPYSVANARPQGKQAGPAIRRLERHFQQWRLQRIRDPHRRRTDGIRIEEGSTRFTRPWDNNRPPMASSFTMALAWRPGKWVRKWSGANWKIEKNGDSPPSLPIQAAASGITCIQKATSRLVACTWSSNALRAGNRFQHRANSGVFFQDTYEVQILDSYGNTGSWDDVGAIYKVSPPRVNASYPPGEWQTLDVEYHPAAFNPGGTLVALPRIRSTSTACWSKRTSPSQARPHMAGKDGKQSLNTSPVLSGCKTTVIKSASVIFGYRNCKDLYIKIAISHKRNR